MSIEKNKPARDYEYRLKVDVAPVFGTDRGSYRQGRLRITVGNAYSAGVHGVELVVTNYSDDPLHGLAEHCVVSIVTPWGTHSETFSGTQRGEDWYVYLDATQLTGACDPWRWSFDAIRFVYDPEGVDDPIWDVGPEVQSGTGYDPRLNVEAWKPTCAVLGPVLLGQAGCPTSPTTGTTQDWNVAWDMHCGWRYRPVEWTTPDQDIVNPDPLDILCSCSTTLPAASEIDSWSQVVPVGYLDKIVIAREPGADFECECIATGQTFWVRVYSVTHELRVDGDELIAHRRDGPIRNYHEHRESSCTIDGSGSTDSDDIDVTTDHTVCLTNRSSDRQIWKRWCGFNDPPIVCPTPVPTPGPPMTCTGELPSATSCRIFQSVVMTWPDKPPCTNPGCRLSADVDDSNGMHVRAFVNDGGDVVVERSDDTLTWSTASTIVMGATSVSIRIDRQSTEQAIYLLAEVSGSIELYSAPIPAGTWTHMRTVASGAKPIIIIGRDGNRYLYWQDSGAVKGEVTDRSDNVLAGPFTVIAGGVDDDCMAGIEDTVSGGARRLVLIDVESGSLVERVSDDGITFT